MPQVLLLSSLLRSSVLLAWKIIRGRSIVSQFPKAKRLWWCLFLLKRTFDVAGKVAPRSNETLELPPEICVIHRGVKGKLLRGAMRLPSVLHSLETALLAAELRDLIGVPISCFKVCAIVIPSCSFELKRLEGSISIST
jgi:hypothetical protein